MKTETWHVSPLVGPKHDEHADCWCVPVVEVHPNGNRLVVHRLVN